MIVRTDNFSVSTRRALAFFFANDETREAYESNPDEVRPLTQTEANRELAEVASTAINTAVGIAERRYNGVLANHFSALASSATDPNAENAE